MTQSVILSDKLDFICSYNSISFHESFINTLNKKSVIGKMVLLLVPDIDSKYLIPGLGKATDLLDDLNQHQSQENTQQQNDQTVKYQLERQLDFLCIMIKSYFMVVLVHQTPQNANPLL